MRLGIFMMALLVVSSAQALTCGYDGTHFWVLSRRLLHQQAVATNYVNAVASCGPGMAALYDGDKWFVFDAKVGRFESFDAANKFRRAVVVAGENLAGLHDGTTVVVYDSVRKIFAEHKGPAGFKFAQATSSRGRLAFYDGASFLLYNENKGEFLEEKASLPNEDDVRLASTDRFTVFYDRAKLLVFDALNHQMQSQAVAKTHFSTLVLGFQGVFFYDGKQLVGYCAPASSFVIEPVGFDPFARGYLDKSTVFSTIRVAGVNYRLFPSRCEITKGPGAS